MNYILNCTSNHPEIFLPRLLETSHSLKVQMAFDRRSHVPPLSACPTTSQVDEIEFALLPVLVTVFNVLNWRMGFILRC